MFEVVNRKNGTIKQVYDVEKNIVNIGNGDFTKYIYFLFYDTNNAEWIYENAKNYKPLIQNNCRIGTSDDFRELD